MCSRDRSRKPQAKPYLQYIIAVRWSCPFAEINCILFGQLRNCGKRRRRRRHCCNIFVSKMWSKFGCHKGANNKLFHCVCGCVCECVCEPGQPQTSDRNANAVALALPYCSPALFNPKLLLLIIRPGLEGGGCQRSRRGIGSTWKALHFACGQLEAKSVQRTGQQKSLPARQSAPRVSAVCVCVGASEATNCNLWLGPYICLWSTKGN